MDKSKQVIIIRKDLKMRRGKEIAQGAHASIKVILDMMEIVSNENSMKMNLNTNDKHIISWISGKFTKIALYVDSENELMEMYQKAVGNNLPCALIIDEGRTEFGGVSTTTCIAIGPADTEEINRISGHLRLA